MGREATSKDPVGLLILSVPAWTVLLVIRAGVICFRQQRLGMKQSLALTTQRYGQSSETELDLEHKNWCFHFEAAFISSSECADEDLNAEAKQEVERLKDKIDGLATREELIDAEKHEVVGVARIRRVILDYFSSVFKSTLPLVEAMEKVLASLDTRVTMTLNKELIRPYTSEEITHTLNQMHNLKSPGLDDMTQLCPISLRNIIYKLASKTIANHLKLFLNSIISTFQSAFVPGRLITGNVLVTYGLNHLLLHKTWGKVGHASLKLDVIKAYGLVE
ncbi:UNVERIFIED_CONTAM: hypothetical protein Sangu_0405400 [Sesamum angustifolium]|uniref:Reverse transcriptase domain-containing protein n=1 Tax=Sesamum angustifolium TaxID=2727405 RepID=A0AAW2QSU5_9LAMI